MGALASGLAVLACFSREHNTLEVGEVAAATGLSTDEVHRAISALLQLGYLYRDEHSERYCLGGEALRFAGAGVGSQELRAFAAPLMEELVESTRLSVGLGIRRGLSMVCIEACRSRTPVALEMTVGTRFPLANTAIGRAYLAACEERERRALVRALHERAGDSAKALDRSLDSALGTYELLGACWSLGDWDSDINGIAVGFNPGHGLSTMAINCGGPAVSTTSTFLVNEVRPRLLHVVERIRREFGQQSFS
jgi:DNA-binding IclR family transcriptional regulator